MKSDFESELLVALKLGIVEAFGERVKSQYSSNPLHESLNKAMAKFAPKIQEQVEEGIKLALESKDFQASIDKALKEKLLAAALLHILGDGKK